jgi:K+-sensing histidine kinase KdpD
MPRRHQYAYPLLIVLVAARVCFALRPHLATIEAAMALLLAVVLVASRYRREPALLASAAAIAMFDFVFVPPYNDMAHGYRLRQPDLAT